MYISALRRNALGRSYFLFSKIANQEMCVYVCVGLFLYIYVCMCAPGPRKSSGNVCHFYARSRGGKCELRVAHFSRFPPARSVVFCCERERELCYCCCYWALLLCSSTSPISLCLCCAKIFLSHWFCASARRWQTQELHSRGILKSDYPPLARLLLFPPVRA